VLPEIERGVALLPLFEGLEREQVRRVAGACGIARFSGGETIIEEGGRDATLFILLSGEAMIRRAGARQPVGVVRTGECLGEMSLLTGEPHSASAVAAQATETAALNHADLAALIRARPDIGLIVFRNLAIGLGAKLGRAPLV
jgi:CRP-like cAMP-binding protein